MVLLDKNGVHSEAEQDFVALEDAPEAGEVCIDLPNDADPLVLAQDMPRIGMIRLHFPSFSDGRGFSQARRLRDMGFQGVIRACGHLLPDQRFFAETCGIDEFDISENLLARTTEQAWLQSTPAPNYRRHLSGES